MKPRFALGLGSMLWALAVACSASDEGTPNQSAGGATGSGGASGSGAAAGSGSATTGGTAGSGAAGGQDSGAGGADGGATGPLRAFPGAEGFGANAKGGRGGDVYHVTTLADGGPGSLREGINSATGPRTIVFEVGGEIKLESRLVINKSNLTLAGQTAPGDGITIRDRSVDIDKAHDIVVRFLRMRRGDIDILASGKPTGSVGLDTVSIDDSKDVIFDHVSLSWSCDELFGIVQNQNVTIQWALMAEPLGDPKLHPYGTEHAFGLNISASTLTLHHSLLANYVMRGPQFEANDATNSQGYDVQMEAVNNVFFDYEHSGSRYTAGIETNPSAASNIDFRFHFRKNLYLYDPNASPRAEIHTELKHGVSSQVKVHVAGNIGPHRKTDTGSEWSLVWTSNTTPSSVITNAPSNVKAQMSNAPLFSPPVAVTEQSAQDAYDAVLARAGAWKKRDAVDQRIVKNVGDRKWSAYLHSQSEVGGFPPLQSGTAVADVDRDGMADAWELSVGLNPADAADRNGDLDKDGWTNLEEYLADLAK
ncbi:MAG: hypothetical protein HYZ29_27590 [Myxococcales bacterium]|nr:hypothetical protein [Myxococcales bacterium]